MAGFALNIQGASAMITKNIQPRFHGNDNVIIEKELTEETLLGILEAYSGNSQVQELVVILTGQRWSITAGFHRGGLGGAAGGADPRPHITLSTGHHIRFDETRRRLVEITGPNISMSQGRAAAAAAAAPPTGAEQELERWQQLGLNQVQALKALRKFHSPGNTMTRTAIATEIRENSSKHK